MRVILADILSSREDHMEKRIGEFGLLLLFRYCKQVYMLLL